MSGFMLNQVASLLREGRGVSEMEVACPFKGCAQDEGKAASAVSHWPEQAHGLPSSGLEKQSSPNAERAGGEAVQSSVCRVTPRAQWLGTAESVRSHFLQTDTRHSVSTRTGFGSQHWALRQTQCADVRFAHHKWVHSGGPFDCVKVSCRISLNIQVFWAFPTSLQGNANVVVARVALWSELGDLWSRPHDDCVKGPEDVFSRTRLHSNMVTAVATCQAW